MPGNDRLVLQVIVGSTRPGRMGLPVGRWVHEYAQKHGGFAVEFIDLAEVALPVLDEPNHPGLRRYTHEHTKRWSATVDRADAYVFVTPEYNHGVNGATKNAIDYRPEIEEGAAAMLAALAWTAPVLRQLHSS